MCGHCKQSPPPSFSWLSGKKVFSLKPFSVVESESDTAPIAKHDGKSSLYVLVAAFNGRARVVPIIRPHSRSEVARKAMRLAERTGNPVLIGEPIVGSQGHLRAIGQVWTAKADPLSVEAFDAWESELSASLLLLAEGEAASMMAASVPYFAFDFMDATDADWLRMQTGLRGVLAHPSEGMIRAQQITMRNQLPLVIRDVGRAMAKTPAIRGTLGASLNLPGRELAQGLTRFHSFWVRNQYGNVSNHLSVQAQRIVERGIRDGLGREGIAERLGNKMRGGLEMPGYWKTVSSNAIAQSRSYSTGASMRAAGIAQYRYVGVGDDRQTEVCNFVDGKIMSNGDAMGRLDRMLSAPTPEEVMDTSPMARQNEDSVYYKYTDGSRRTLFDVITPHGGSGGSPGVYANALSNEDLAAAGLGYPPLHHQCRTTVVAV